MNDIYIGSLTSPLFHFADDNIEKLTSITASDVIGTELAFDEMGAVIDYSPTSGIDAIPYGTPIWWENDQLSTTKMYIKSCKRVGKTRFELKAVSAVGVLDGIDFYGNIYNGATFSDIVDEIIGDTMPYTIADDLADIRVYGWLGIMTRRAALHQLLFATGAQIVKDDDGEVLFRFPESETFSDVPRDRIYIGGSLDYLSPASVVNVTEHSWFSSPNDKTVTLFDNTDGSGSASNLFVSFSAPVYGLEVTGTLTISEFGANYAIVSGVGTLVGKEYSHSTKIVTTQKNGINAEQKAVSVTDATLVSSVNSYNVAKRVLGYYSSAHRVKSSIVLDGEKAGDLIQFYNAFDEPDSGFIANMSLNASSFIKADCEIVSGYVPSGGGNNFNAVEEITESGTFTVPDNVTLIRLVLFQGGHGGQGGYNGEKGRGEVAIFSPTDDYLWYSEKAFVYPYGHQTRASGGAGGEKGSAGKVLVIDLEVTPGTVITLNNGAGGAGGSPDGGLGTSGGHTTATINGVTYSSENGSIPEFGFVDLLNGNVYAIGGNDGFSGGDGGLAGGDAEGATFGYEKNGQDGENVGAFLGGLGGNVFSGYPLPNYNVWGTAGGGGGGGAAYGANGENGTDARVNQDTSGTTLLGGHGGKGADAAAPTNPSGFGAGGNGGHGGGAGGNRAGSSWIEGNYLHVGSDPYPGSRDGCAPGGLGSAGSDGAPGGALIYY